MATESEHIQRVLSAISGGAERPAQIQRQTCLGPTTVSEALRVLRKRKLVIEDQGKYRRVTSNDQVTG
jgi:DNA-binding IclR family transcriptional regulator